MTGFEAALKGAAIWGEVKDKLKASGLSLSGGQQQRLCIARTVAIHPEVILLDEPCSALDPISTAKIEELIDELKEKYTIAIVTHNMQQAARVSDFTAFMYLGELIEFETLLRKCSLRLSRSRRKIILPAVLAECRTFEENLMSDHIVRAYDQELELLGQKIAEMGGIAEERCCPTRWTPGRLLRQARSGDHQ